MSRGVKLEILYYSSTSDTQLQLGGPSCSTYCNLFQGLNSLQAIIFALFYESTLCIQQLHKLTKTLLSKHNKPINVWVYGTVLQ